MPSRTAGAGTLPKPQITHVQLLILKITSLPKETGYLKGCRLKTHDELSRQIESGRRSNRNATHSVVEIPVTLARPAVKDSVGLYKTK